MMTRLFVMAALLTAMVMPMGCQSANSSTTPKTHEESGLQIYAPERAKAIISMAKSRQLTVHVISDHSAERPLIESLLKVPNDEALYFAVVNPVRRSIIGGGALSPDVQTSELERFFDKIQQVQQAGMEQVSRLSASNEGAVRLIVFSDYQCPYCSVMEGFIEEWKGQYGKQLEVDMVHFPLPMHPEAESAAKAAECAREQGKFDEYSAQLFQKQKQLNASVYPKIAQSLGLDQTVFKACVQENRFSEKIEQDRLFGEYMGITGTPTLVLNSEFLTGLSAEQVQAKLQEKLGSTSPSTGE